MRRILILMAGIMLVVTTAGFGAGAAEGDVIRLGHIRDTSHPTHLGALRFQEIVEAETDLEVNVFPDSQLGDPQEMFAQLQTGDLEMVYGGINTFAWIDGGEPFEITAIPFLYRDYEHMRDALNADFFAPVIEQAEEDTGIRVLAITGDTAPRGLSTTDREVRHADDFQGLTVRTAAAESVLRAMEALGATPEQVPYDELYIALQTGVVDAQENGVIATMTDSFYEVQNYYIQTDYIRDVETFYGNPQWWDSLDESDQSVILAAAEEAGELVTQLTQQELSAAYDYLADHLTVIRDPDIESIQDALEGVYDDWDGDLWPAGLLEQVSDM